MRFLRITTIGFCLLLCGNYTANADETTSSLAYKLAILQERARSPEAVLMKQPIIPRNAQVQEFQWILSALENRCLNPPNAIADTIVEVWNAVQQRGASLTLLDVAHKLQSFADNAYQREHKEVNFRMTSFYWLKHYAGDTTQPTEP